MIAVMFVAPAVASAAPKAPKGVKPAKSSAKAADAKGIAGKAMAAPAKQAASAKAHAAAKKTAARRSRKVPKSGAVEKRSRARKAKVLGVKAPKTSKTAGGTAAGEPLGDKNSGPCTRHTHRDGQGHDFHRGWGWGHYGKTVAPSDPGDPDVPGDPGNGTRPTPAGEPAGGTDKPAPPPEDFLPFTPVLPVVFRPKQADPEAERYLPFTGSDSTLLLALAALAGLLGGALRGASRVRLQAYRRIAR